MECGKCYEDIYLHCASCNSSEFIDFHEDRVTSDCDEDTSYFIKCRKCIQLHDQEIAKQKAVAEAADYSHKAEVAKQRAVAKAADVSHKAEVAKQRGVLEAADERNRKLSTRLGFLKLQAPEPSTESDFVNGDVTILVQGGQAIRAHRFILAQKSPVFRRMFDCEMTERRTGVISIDDASHSTMQTVVNFCYNAEVDFKKDVRADEVLRVAHKYQILHLRDLCAEELVKRISRENVLEILKLSRDCEAKQLLEATGKYLKEHFGEIFPAITEAL